MIDNTIEGASRRASIKKKCPICKRFFLGYGSNYYCIECYWPAMKEGMKAIGRVQKEIRHGRLKPAKEFQCVDCGRKAQVYDHRDYSKPLEIAPVCLKCNHKRGPAVRK